MSEDTMNELLTWIDYETTGLDADKDVILEMGLIVTDKVGNELDSWQTLVRDNTYEWEERVAEVASATTQPDSFVRDMHEKNGLWYDLALMPIGDIPSTSQAQFDAIEFLDGAGVQHQTSAMFGSSIGSLDRPFAKKQMPYFNDHLHYRNMDNSSVKILAQMHAPWLIEQWDEEYKTLELEGQEHRVLYDIRASIAEYQFYLANFLRIEGK